MEIFENPEYLHSLYPFFSAPFFGKQESVCKSRRLLFCILRREENYVFTSEMAASDS